MSPRTLPATIFMPGGRTQEFAYRPSPADFEAMDRALYEAQLALAGGDSPIGSVLITPGGWYPAQTTEFREGKLLGHAEMNAIEQAQPEVGRDLSACTLVTTAEPCVGCSYILDKGHLGMLIIAATRDDAPEFFRQRSVTLERIWGESNRTLTVVRGLRRLESARLLTASTKRH